MQAHTAAKQLNRLAAFPFGEVDQAHGGNAPAVPALGEFAGTDQDTDIGIRLIKGTEQGTGGEFLCLADDILLLAVFDQRSRIADIDDTEIAAMLADFEANLPIRLPQVFHVQARFIRNSIRVEHDVHHIGINILGVDGMAEDILQRQEIAVEKLMPVGINQAGVLIQHGLNPSDGFCFIAHESIQEGQHFLHVGQFFLAGLGSNTVTNEYQQRLFNLERRIFLTMGQVQFHLLIEGEQAAGQV